MLGERVAQPGPLADRQNWVMWEEASEQDTRVWAVARVEELLHKHRLPGLPPEVDPAIRAKFSILL